MPARKVIIIGAGPSGLSAAYELTRHNLCPTVLEKGSKVGGISRTENYKGFLIDMGGHRFFSKAERVNEIWRDILGEDFLRRPRLSRIYYNRKFFNYPLKPLNALMGLGPLKSSLIVLSYLKWQFLRYRKEETFEQWVTNRFGRCLFSTFFRAYTEKVWGIPCSQLKAEWAAQRIQNLSLRTALLSMFFKLNKGVKTLIEEFDYPRLGPGMLWDAVRERIERGNDPVRLNCGVIRINRTGNRIDSLTTLSNGQEEVVTGTHFISSMPITELVKRLNPPPEPHVLRAAQGLKYRDYITVCLIVNKPDLFPDNWIYIHDPEVNVGRVQNFKNWSIDMVPDSGKTSLGLEYFCTEGDELWKMPDADLVELGKKEVDLIGLASYGDVEDGCVYRVAKAYPIYDFDYKANLSILRGCIGELENLQTIGRNGLFRYNNQDHAMLTGIFSARNLTLDERNDLWSINEEQEHHQVRE